MTRISVRGFAVASATAVTTVGAVVGVASGSEQSTTQPVEATAADATLLADIPAGQQAQVQTASLTQQADNATIVANAAARKAAEETARMQAAKDAAAKRAAAEKAAAEKAEREAREREEAKQVASRSAERTDFAVKSSYTVAEVKAMAQQIVGAGQFQCFSNIIERESGWNYTAQNPSSGAYGLVQALPGSKMASAGADWQTNPATQITWGLGYISGRYGTPCGAWAHSQRVGWY